MSCVPNHPVKSSATLQSQGNISPMVTQCPLQSKHMIRHYCPAPGPPGALSFDLFRLFTWNHSTSNTRISSRIKTTDLYFSDAKLIYREEQQPFWNVRGVQSRHGTLVNYSRSRLLLRSKLNAVNNILYGGFIFTV